MSTPEEKHYYQQAQLAAQQQKEMQSAGSSGKVSTTETSSVDVPVPASRSQIPAELLESDADDLLVWLCRYPVERNHPRSLTGTVAAKRSGEVMVLEQKERITDALNKLITEGFSSAPVIDSSNRYISTVDLLDLAWYFVNSFRSWREEEKLKDESQRSSYWTRFLTQKQFQESTVADAMNRPAWERKCNFPPVFKGFSTLYPMELMFRANIHRVPIVNKDHKVINILTQSMIISLFDQNLHRFGPLKDKKVSSMTAGLVQELITVSEDDLALEAFQKMVDKNITGLAVVNKQGILVDNLSVRDLRGIGMQGDKWERLWLPVKIFKARVREDFNIQTPSNPITVNNQETLNDVIRKMDDGNLHRIFVVEYNQNSEPIPKYVISQRDVVRFVLYRLGLDAKTVLEE